MEDILKSILKTEAAAEDLVNKARAEAKKVMDNAENETAAISKEFSVKTEGKVAVILDAAKKDGEAARSGMMKAAQAEAKKIEEKSAAGFGAAVKVCLDYLIGK